VAETLGCSVGTVKTTLARLWQPYGNKEQRPMQLDEQIREALAREAAAIPAGAAERLRRIDYRPRSHMLPSRLAGGVLVGAAATAGAMLAFGGTTAQVAFAGWRATPTRASAAQTSAAEATCRARLARGSKHGVRADTNPRLTDTRGPFTLIVYDQATCLVGPGFVSLAGHALTGGVSIGTTSRSGRLYTIAEGPAPAGVTSVALSLDDGARVEATVANSSFGAWWPSAHRPTSVVIDTPSETQTKPLSFPPAPEQPTGKPRQPTR
jgi:hypothetical protein